MSVSESPGRKGLRPVLFFAGAATLLALGACSHGSAPPAASKTVKGTVKGLIQDSQGHAIQFATVTYTGDNTSAPVSSKVSTQTDVDGNFELDSVILDGTTASQSASLLTLAVEPPSSTPALSATVQVPASAQVVSGGGSIPSTYINGFLADTGLVRIPLMSSSITGILRDSTTGAAVVGQSLSLAWEGVEYTYTPTNGVIVNLTAPAYAPVLTQADGSFTMAAIYNDSCVRITGTTYNLPSNPTANVFIGGVPTQAVSGSAPSCLTTNPPANSKALTLSDANAATIDLANVYATLASSGDNIPPFVASVANVLNPAVTPGILATTVTGTDPNAIVINFSEPVQNLFSTGDIQIVSGSDPGEAPASATLSDDGMQLVIDTATPLTPGTAFNVLILAQDIKDLGGNLVTVTNTAIAYDSFSGTQNQYFTLALEVATP